MRALAILLCGSVVLVLGLAIGATPVLNENLHWNIWFVVPISGLLLGCVFGWLQFRIAYLMGAPIRTPVAVGLALAAMLGYAATDVGTYATIQVQLVDEEGTPVGVSPLRDLISFPDYMRAQLASSAIALRPGGDDSPNLDMGQAAATASFGIDLLGCLVGAFGLIRLGAKRAPFCDRCSRYKTPSGRVEAALDEETAVEKMTELQEHVHRGEYPRIVSFIGDLAKAAPEKSPIKLVGEERVCGGCNEATLTGRVLRRHGNEWKDVGELGFRVHSSTGETARLRARG